MRFIAKRSFQQGRMWYTAHGWPEVTTQECPPIKAVGLNVVWASKNELKYSLPLINLTSLS